MDENMNDLEKFKRHMNLPVEIELDNLDGSKDKFKIMPLTNIDLIGFMNLCGKMAKYFGKDKTKEELNESMNAVPTELWDNLFYYLKKSVRGAYPNITEDVLDGFITKNFVMLYPKIVEVNSQSQEVKQTNVPQELIKEQPKEGE